MKKTLLQTLLMWVLMSATAMAQSITVKGKVTDESGAPVPSATIQIKNSSVAVATDAQGNFSISAASLTASCKREYYSPATSKRVSPWRGPPSPPPSPAQA